MAIGNSIRETLLFWLINFPVRSSYVNRKRWVLLRLAGVDIASCDVRAPVNFMQVGQLNRISIGKDSFINAGLRIGVSKECEVRIGENCIIGPYVSMETASHELKWQPDRGWGAYAKSIIIGDQCWIGTRAVILGGGNHRKRLYNCGRRGGRKKCGALYAGRRRPRETHTQIELKSGVKAYAACY